jgi:hypothetical protein
MSDKVSATLHERQSPALSSQLSPRGWPFACASVYPTVTNRRHGAAVWAAPPGNGRYAWSFDGGRAREQKEDQSCYSP